VYDQAGRVRYLPQNGPRDRPTKKKKKPQPGRPDSPVQDYDQSDLSNLLNKSSQYLQARIQMQEEEVRAQNAREQAMIQKRLAKGPRDASPRED
jgi:hypothetical protein